MCGKGAGGSTAWGSCEAPNPCRHSAPQRTARFSQPARTPASQCPHTTLPALPPAARPTPSTHMRPPPSPCDEYEARFSKLCAGAVDCAKEMVSALPAPTASASCCPMRRVMAMTGMEVGVPVCVGGGEWGQVRVGHEGHRRERAANTAGRGHSAAGQASPRRDRHRHGAAQPPHRCRPAPQSRPPARCQRRGRRRRPHPAPPAPSPRSSSRLRAGGGGEAAGRRADGTRRRMADTRGAAGGRRAGGAAPTRHAVAPAVIPPPPPLASLDEHHRARQPRPLAVLQR